MPQNRKSSPRLRGYEYSLPGGYFVTICTYKRVNSFGEVLDREMLLNRAGEIAQSAWRDLPNHYVNIQLDHYVVMPNHLHGIIFIKETDRRDRFLNLSLQKQHGLSEIVRGYKTWSARKMNQAMKSTGSPVWQRSFHDRVIRDEEELNRIREYIEANPLNWERDEENPKNI